MRALARAGVLLLLPWAFASVMPIPGSERIDRKLNQASLVVKGRVIAVEAGSVTEGLYLGTRLPLRNAKAIIGIERVYKGKPQGTTVAISYTFPADAGFCTVNPCAVFRPGDYELYFLAELNGESVLLDQFQSRFSVSQLNADGEVLTDPALSLRLDLVAGLNDASDEKAAANARLLGGLNDPAVVPVLRKESGRASKQVSGWAYVGLLRQRDYSNLRGVQDYLELDTTDPHVRFLKGRIAAHVESIRSPEAREALRRMAASRSGVARIAAIVALREIRDVLNVPTFIEALGDPSWRARYSAIMGLCTFEPEMKGCDADIRAFQSADSESVKAWKAWWEAEGRARYLPQSK